MKTLFDSVGRMQEALSFHRDRHAVLAGNLANLDTPGFRAADLERKNEDPATFAVEAQAAMARTNPGHMAGPADPGASGPAGVVKFDDAAANPNGDGNAVDLEREMAKIAANKVRYATTTELVSRRMALLRYTAGDGT
jgi:flagellar basal-body rod protein FlgB